MTSAPEAHKTAGVVVADLLALGREIENTHGEEARKLLDAAAAALSTPSVPAVAELWGDGLAQSAASGAAAGWMPMESAPKDGKEVILRIPARGWPDHYQQIAHWADDMSGEEQPPFRGWFRNTGYGYAEVADPTGWRPLTASPAGDDPKALDAAARSSPLPPQGEPVAVEGWVPNTDYTNKATWPPEGNLLYTAFHDARLKGGWYDERLKRLMAWASSSAEALAAERARADSLKAERDAEADIKWQHHEMVGKLAKRAFDAEARADRAEEDERDRLYAKAAEESRLCASVVFREDAARTAAWLAENGAMLPAQRAALRARTLLKETPHDER
ncbi:hypothetical protein [Antarcticirhabdus aurantiaca]|uniref:Uncharacterized protein n=1 Tax=Antarcticirhabdus aurantiaca TaxID=2606717 RepID=A0ACD4NJZ8_9HYPH|nr:hypothetical protein [Antarcticirhabdus aurantiaca]WAJ27157.1 hypothetical protein OXU80_20205 [Jeongeuplla avenae]